MFNLTFHNNFSLPITVSPIGQAPQQVLSGASQTFNNCTTTLVNISGMPPLTILDIGNKQLPKYPLTHTWGLLFYYQTVELYSRYEGGGSYDITIDDLAEVSVKSSFEIIMVSLSGLSIGK